MEHQSAIQAVALGPAGPVENHRGQEQQHTEAEQRPQALPGTQPPHQPQASPGQHHVEENGNQLNQVQVGDGYIGDEGQKVQIGGVVVANGHFHGREAAVFPKKRHPSGEEVQVIRRLVVQEHGPQEEGQANGNRQIERLLQALRMGRCGPNRPRRQREQQHKDARLSPGAPLPQVENRDQTEQQQRQTEPPAEPRPPAGRASLIGF